MGVSVDDLKAVYQDVLDISCAFSNCQGGTETLVSYFIRIMCFTHEFSNKTYEFVLVDIFPEPKQD